MFELAICDDSKSDAEYIRQLCLEYKKETDISVSVFLHGSALISEHSKSAFDIVLLDVDMPGSNGLELAKTIHKSTPQTIIIFVTSYPQYAIEAYDCEAFHYLLKPCDSQKLYQVINRAISKLIMTKKYHLIKSRGETVRLNLSDIYYIECCRKHIIYYTKDDKYDTIDTLNNVYGQLKEYGFYQVHQGFIVNFENVSRFDKYSVILNNGTEVMVSVRKRKESINAYLKYVEMYV